MGKLLNIFNYILKLFQRNKNIGVDMTNTNTTTSQNLSDIKISNKDEPIFEVKNTINVFIDIDYLITKNFRFKDLVKTEHRNFIDKNIEEGKKFIDNMKKLCESLLEPIIEITKEIPIITSCFRCPELNKAIGGSKTSQHLIAEAADMVFKSDKLENIYKKIMNSNLMYSQLILEFNSWIHIGIIDDTYCKGKVRQNLICVKENNSIIYKPYI